MFDVARHREQLTALEKKTAEPGLWDDPAAAQKILQERKQAEDRVEADRRLERWLEDLETYIHLAREETDATQHQQVLAELAAELDKAEAYVADLETRTLLAGENDRLNAIVNIKPGAGGTESQDWAEMLLRMYLKWAERHGFRTTVLDAQPGEEAGMKAATLRVEGENAYGLLAGETGVHRLVRISPFDQAARRHTSFASVFVIPEVDDRIEVVIRPEDLRIDTYRSSGHGGQHVNVTDSAVRITHLPTGIVSQCQNERSQYKNREMAMKVLRSRIYELELEKRQAEAQKLEDQKPEISFGSQIRSYVLQPYQMIKDHRTKLEIGDVNSVLDGGIDPFIHAYLVARRAPGGAAAAGDGSKS
ncbi:MAG TPA: peptide chain release factor 2 [Candidatus Acidoferrales bacterium]|nr:peptide chain release factor 2 [Candidatus Acidoferrales bacterium]